MMSRSVSTTTLVVLMLFLLGPSSRHEAASSRPARACQKLSGINPEVLCQQWVHSSEEQKGNDKTQLYRPSGFKQFPPSRGRMKYIFYKNGDCEWLFFSPDDAHRLKPGRWEIDSNDKRILRINKGDMTESYRVIELTKDILRIVLIEPAMRQK